MVTFQQWLQKGKTTATGAPCTVFNRLLFSYEIQSGVPMKSPEFPLPLYRGGCVVCMKSNQFELQLGSRTKCFVDDVGLNLIWRSHIPLEMELHCRASSPHGTDTHTHTHTSLCSLTNFTGPQFLSHLIKTGTLFSNSNHSFTALPSWPMKGIATTETINGTVVADVLSP